MKKIILILAFALPFVAFAEGNFPEGKGYIVKMNLNEITNDVLEVTVITPTIMDEEVEYHMPKMVPGTYSIYDFGRFVSGFKAYDKDGNELKTEQITENRIKISDATSLYKLVYTVDDTYDSELDNVVFEPAGTNFEAGKNHVINPYTMVGYINGYQDLPYEMNVTRPENFYGSTAMKKVSSTDNQDVFLADSYFRLADSPLMFNEANVVNFDVGGADIEIAVYSPTDKMSAESIQDDVREILEAQKDYLGGTLPIDKYAFIIYLSNGPSLSGSYGALEHSYSSMYYLPEMDPSFLSQTVRDVAAHEFFHIVTPLSIHSEEIGNYDWINPVMSKHLWLYEGVTEYSAGHVQVKHGLMPMKDYFSVIVEKVQHAKQFKDDLPFTEMSKGVLHEYEDQFINVYQKGALIGLCLDLLLEDLSDGEYGVQELMRDLSKKYGIDQSFEDDKLFDEITELTGFPEVREFFKRYVEGPEPLPLKEYLAKAGIDMNTGGKTRTATMGNISMGFNQETGRLIIQSLEKINDFGRAMKYQTGDEIVSVQGQELGVTNFQQVFDDYADTKDGEKVTVVVARKNKKGKEKLKKLKAKAQTIEVEKGFEITASANATERQLMIRKAWLGRTQ